MSFIKNLKNNVFGPIFYNYYEKGMVSGNVQFKLGTPKAQLLYMSSWAAHESIGARYFYKCCQMINRD